MEDETSHGLAFATLTPANTLAKMAFTDVYDTVTEARQGSTEDHALQRMQLTSPEQSFDQDVLRMTLELSRDIDDGSATDVSESDITPEQRAQGLLWEGRYLLGFIPEPYDVDSGWNIGLRTPGRDIQTDVFLCTKAFSKKHGLNIRTLHGRFNFSMYNKALFATSSSRSQIGAFTVNGINAKRQIAAINQRRMTICCDRLEYILEYTAYADTAEFLAKRNEYCQGCSAAPSHTPVEFTTPVEGTRTIGQWTIGKPVGKGIMGRVSSATNATNEMAAVKVVDRTLQAAPAVAAEIETNRKVTEMAQAHDVDEHIVRQREVIYLDSEAHPGRAAFDEVAIVLQPLTPQTMSNFMNPDPLKKGKGMSIRRAALFRDALRSIKVMHDQNWIHRDVKPANIGVIGEPPKAILLDTGTAIQVRDNEKIVPTPGRLGTIGFLAPEYELHPYDFGVDVWAMGIIGYMMMYTQHPWKLKLNPWRSGTVYEPLLPLFHQHYTEVIQQLAADHARCRDNPSDGYIHRNHHISSKVKMASSPLQPGTASGQSSPGITMFKPRRGPFDVCLPGDEAWAARVIELQGNCLQSCVDTPVWRQSAEHHDKFVSSLQTKLRWLLTDQNVRVSKYGKFVAREWAVGKTPREIVARFSTYHQEFSERSDSDTEYSDHEPRPKRKSPLTRWNRKSREKRRAQEERDAALIIETQGAHLPTRPSTPVRQQLQNRPSRSFAYSLTTALHGLMITLEERRNVYGEQEAVEWRVGHTPPSVAAHRGYSVEEKGYYSSKSTADTPDISEESEPPVPKDNDGEASRESPAVPVHYESTTRPGNTSTILHSSSSPPSDVKEKQRGAARLPMTPLPTASPDSRTDLCIKRQLRDDSRQALLHPSPGYIHLGALFLDMLRFPWARGPQVLPRINIDEVLNHPSWGPEFLLPPVTEAAPAQS
ncbi:camk family protein kinase [Ophiostoma piceae UAMH 11346]|uniref:Camk family protein kinase n=1 Tax=Ophiostoma piceae (strain UAMH 11346) TaxID=1262450 RepID=S3C6T0_OPHP1|nr:camk family protein kinase [Ophiostoma piceae UAMH 11346]